MRRKYATSFHSISNIHYNRLQRSLNNSFDSRRLRITKCTNVVIEVGTCQQRILLEREREKNRGIKIDPSVAGTTCNLVMKSIPRSSARARGSKSRDMDWGSSRPDVTQCFPLICCSRAVRPCSPSSSGRADDRARGGCARRTGSGCLVANRVSAFCQLCFRLLLAKACLSRGAPSSHALLMGTSVRETVIMITLPIEKPTRSPSPSSRLIRIIIPRKLSIFSRNLYLNIAG